MTTRARFGVFIVIGLLGAAALAFFVSPYASGEPDGLNKVAIDNGFAVAETPHAMQDLPTAGYQNPALSGLLGVTLTFALAGGLMLVVRRRRHPRTTDT